MYIQNAFLFKQDYSISVWYLGEFSKEDLSFYLLRNFDIKKSSIIERKEATPFVEKHGCKMVKLEYNSVTTREEDYVEAGRS